MKRLGLWLVAVALCATMAARAQDAATEERLKQLSGKIEDLIAGQESLRKRIEEVAGQLESLKEQQGRPAPNYASPEDLRQLAKAIEKVDAKRIEDNEKIHADLLKLMDAVKATPAAPPRKSHPAGTSAGSKKNSPSTPDNPADESDGGSDRFFKYRVESGDTLSAIVAAFHEKHIMVTEREILKANPGLRPERLRVGMDIYVPIPKPPGASR
jgi:TolA-binding protein